MCIRVSLFCIVTFFATINQPTNHPPLQVAELMRARLLQDWDEAKKVAQETGGDADEAVAGMQSGEELFDEINKG